MKQYHKWTYKEQIQLLQCSILCDGDFNKIQNEYFKDFDIKQLKSKQQHTNEIFNMHKKVIQQLYLNQPIEEKWLVLTYNRLRFLQYIIQLDEYAKQGFDKDKVPQHPNRIVADYTINVPGAFKFLWQYPPDPVLIAAINKLGPVEKIPEVIQMLITRIPQLKKQQNIDFQQEIVQLLSKQDRQYGRKQGEM